MVGTIYCKCSSCSTVPQLSCFYYFTQYLQFQGFHEFLSGTVAISQLHLWLDLASAIPTSTLEPEFHNDLNVGRLLAIRKCYWEILETLCLVSGTIIVSAEFLSGFCKREGGQFRVRTTLVGGNHGGNRSEFSDCKQIR